MSLPWYKANTARVLAWRDDRITEGRAASHAEAYGESMALLVCGRLGGMGFATLARSLRWSPGKLRRAMAEWETDEQQADSYPRWWRTAWSKVSTASSEDGEQQANSRRTAGEPSRALPIKEKEEDREVPVPEEQLYEAWRTLGKGRRKSPSPARLKYLRARIKQDGLDTCLLVNDWAHNAESSKFWQDTPGLQAIETLFKADKWDSRVELAMAWDADGKPTRSSPKASTAAADHKQDAEKWFAAVHGLASAGKKPMNVRQMMAMLGNNGDPTERTLAAWDALTVVGRCSKLGEANAFETTQKRKQFISTYTAARGNETAALPVQPLNHGGE